jgi:hypothetical protein
MSSVHTFVTTPVQDSAAVQRQQHHRTLELPSAQSNYLPMARDYPTFPLYKQRNLSYTPPSLLSPTPYSFASCASFIPICDVQMTVELTVHTTCCCGHFRTKSGEVVSLNTQNLLLECVYYTHQRMLTLSSQWDSLQVQACVPPQCLPLVRGRTPNGRTVVVT